MPRYVEIPLPKIMPDLQKLIMNNNDYSHFNGNHGCQLNKNSNLFEDNKIFGFNIDLPTILLILIGIYLIWNMYNKNSNKLNYNKNKKYIN